MEKFVVSARKYRPDSFDTVVGQPSITKTLKNAIRTNQLAHAYLFCGPRGVGKTTCARIFAKTINCQSLSEQTEACGKCESCKSFSENRSFTIHELDAASNNHVDDIRNLIDQVRIPPQIGKYSIYIIDEVHMLSQQAFNAFLKTLEEPPAHAIFILATTEKHKIIPTILSRCQIFDFNRIKVSDMMEHLSEVADRESVEAEDAALNIIAQKADGSMRDALSIFDQVVSFSGKKVSYQMVVDNLNVLDYEYYFKLTEAFLDGNYQAALLLYNDILNKGFDSHNFINGLGGHFRNLLVTKDPETIALMELSGEIAEKYLFTAQLCQTEWLFKALGIINQSDIHFKQAKDPRLHIEITLLKIARINRVVLSEELPIKQPASSAKPQSIVTKTVAQATTPAHDAPVAPAEPAQEDSPTTATLPGSRDVLLSEKKQQGLEPPVGSTRDQSVSDADSAGEPVISTSKLGSNGLKSGPRISDHMRKSVEPGSPGESHKNEPDTNQVNKLSQKLLEEKWAAFAETIKEEQPRLYNTLNNQLPELDALEVKVKLNNPLQAKAMKSIHNELEGYLKKHCGNPGLHLAYEIQTTPVVEKKLYTQEEKYRHLQQKNPDLELFRQSFKLDFE